MVREIPQVPRVPPTAVLRVDKTTSIKPHDFPLNNQMLEKHKARRQQHAQKRSKVSDSAPACNILSQTKTMTEAASRGRSNTRANNRMSQSTHVPPDKCNKTTISENAAEVEQGCNIRHTKQTTKKLSNLEIEVHQAMAVMDEQTGRLLNYK